MVLKVAKRGAVPPFIVMDVLRAANTREAAGEAVLHLEVGQPGTGAPRPVIEAAKAVLGSDALGYTEALGMPALRERIAAHYKTRHGLDVSPERVVVTTGASGGFLLAFLSAFDPGDRVGVTEPGYPAYRNILAALDLVPVPIRALPENRFQPTVTGIEPIADRLEGMILASPSNPTGTMLDANALQGLAAFCTARGIRLVSDEIYHGITYGEPAATALAYNPEAIVVNSFSKYFSMTGWRIGWMVVPKSLLRSIECLAQNLFISAPTLSQHGALRVFDCTDELDAYVAAYARNRDLLLKELPKAGFKRLAPADGAFYLYADISGFSDDSEGFCRRMLEETGVATTPGIDFDPKEGNRYVRFSFAGAEATMAEAIHRLQAWRS
ncbi:MAG: pyridoxal phosphate-dependent aminotransferase [Pseudomonadota bacterium]